MSDNPLADWLHARERDRHADAADAPARAGRGGEPDELDGDAWTQPPTTTDGRAVSPLAVPWEDDTEEPARSRRRWPLFVAALVPWVAAGGFMLALADGEDAHTAAPASTQTPVTSSVSAGRGEAGHGGAPSTGGASVPSPYAAAAVRAVRSSNAAAGATGTTPQASHRHVDLALAESLTHVGDLAVVTVVAAVLEGSAEQWERTEWRRFGVAVQQTDDGPAPAGPPWLLPGPAADHELRWEEASGDDEPVEAALVAAGYEPAGPPRLWRSDAAPGVIRVDVHATGPDEAVARTHEVWVRAEPEPMVLGGTPPRLPAERSQPTPSADSP